jgi:nickel/cobalt exporter
MNMNPDSNIIALLLTAASLGFLHTLFGPDHYIPFVVMSRAGKWSLSKTALITVVCGVGHVISSVVIGSVGIALGVAVIELETIESIRGNLAGWLFIGFGFAFMVWGMRRTLRNRNHSHPHVHNNRHIHSHRHSHKHEHLHAHGTQEKKVTPWILFTLFVFGPCELLIPVLMYPAAKSSMYGIVMVTAVFGLVTISTMLAVVLLSIWGISFVRFEKLEPHTHALAGASICLCGLAIQFLGL